MAQREKVIIRCMDCEKDGLYEMWNDINSKTNQEQKKQLLSFTIHLPALPFHALCGPSYAVLLSGS